MRRHPVKKYTQRVHFRTKTRESHFKKYKVYQITIVSKTKPVGTGGQCVGTSDQPVESILFENRCEPDESMVRPEN
jgi:hypothetical protein